MIEESKIIESGRIDTDAGKTTMVVTFESSSSLPNVFFNLTLHNKHYCFLIRRKMKFKKFKKILVSR